MTDNIFSGLFDLVSDFSQPSQTEKLSIIPETSKVPSEKSEWVTSNVVRNSIDPISQKTLISNGMGSDISKILNNIPLISKENPDKTTVFRKNNYTYQEYETKIMGKSPNLELNLNPHNFPPESFLTDENLEEQLKKNLSDNEAKSQSEKDSKTFDKIRLTIYDLNTRIENFTISINEIFDSLLSKITLEEQTKIKKYLYRYEVLYTTKDVILDGTTLDQLLDLKSFLNSFVLLTQISFSKNSISNKDTEDFNYNIRNFIQELNVLITEDYSKYLSVMLEDIRKLRKSYGPFIELYKNQNVNYSLDNISFKGFLPSYSTLRRSYTDTGHSSVSKLATSYGKKGTTIREHVDNVESVQSFKPFFMATPSDGSGDKIQKSDKVTTIPYQNTIGPLTEDEFLQYKTKLAEKESSNSYSKVNTIGFLGKWQFGAPVLIDLGYVKPGTSTRNLIDDNVWTGKDGIVKRSDFLANKNSCQDNCLLDYTRINYKTLLRNNVISLDTSKNILVGFLAAAHLKGPGGARNFKNGIITTDAYGTSTEKYYTEFSSIFPEQSIEERRNNPQKVGETTVLDSAIVVQPLSPASPRYPYNSVTEYESGHFKEYDSTPGNERIQERHRSGTGYEILSDGSRKETITKNNYQVVLGDNFIQVTGQVQIIVHGDCGIKANGNVNINAGNDLNMVVGGNFNLEVAGNSSSKIKGSQNNMIFGDLAELVSGFKKVGIDGDYQIEAASQNMVSKSTDINIAAKGKINSMAVSDINQISSGNIASHSKGNYTSTSDGSTVIASKSAATISSIDGDASLVGKSKANVTASSGSVNLYGSSLKVNQDLESSIYSQRSGIAGRLGSAPAQPKTGTAGSSGSDSHTEGQKLTDIDKNKSIVEKFNPIKGDTTQSYGGGQGTLNGYDKAFQ